MTATVTVRVFSSSVPLSFSYISTVNETAVIRWNYGDVQLGTCKETIEGGNHFRYWPQNGPQGNRYCFKLFCLRIENFIQFIGIVSGAFFLAASYEKPLTGEFGGWHG